MPDNRKRASESILNPLRGNERPPKKVKPETPKKPALNMGNLLSATSTMAASAAAEEDYMIAATKLKNAPPAPTDTLQLLQKAVQASVPTSNMSSLSSQVQVAMASLPQTISSIASIRNTLPQQPLMPNLQDSAGTISQQLPVAAPERTETVSASDQIASLMQFIRSGEDASSPGASALFNASTVHVDLNNAEAPQASSSASSMLGLSLGNGALNNPMFAGTTVDLLEGKNAGAMFGSSGNSMLGLNFDGFNHSGNSMLGLNLDLGAQENEETAQRNGSN
jgi:hypothetical protein